jgi:hypothetical protein
MLTGGILVFVYMILAGIALVTAVVACFAIYLTVLIAVFSIFEPLNLFLFPEERHPALGGPAVNL